MHMLKKPLSWLTKIFSTWAMEFLFKLLWYLPDFMTCRTCSNLDRVHERLLGVQDLEHQADLCRT